MHTDALPASEQKGCHLCAVADAPQRTSGGLCRTPIPRGAQRTGASRETACSGRTVSDPLNL